MRLRALTTLLALAVPGTAFAQTINVPADYATIQAAIDNVASGGTIEVDPGTYVESLLVDPAGTHGTPTGQTSFSIVALGAVTVEWPALATRQAAYDPSITTVSGKQIDAILHVTGTTSLSIDGITFEGNGDMDPSTGSVTSCGVSFRDGSGTLTDCTIRGVELSPSSGAQGGIGALVEGPLGGTSVTFDGCTFTENQKNFITATNDAACDVSGCTMTGRGVTTSLAQNALQYSSGAYGNVDACVFDGFWWNGTSSFTSTGILAFGSGAPINVSNSTFIDCQTGYYQFGDGTAVVDDEVTGNVFSQESFPVSANGIIPVGVIYASVAAGSEILIQNNSFNGLQDVGVAMFDTGGTITGNYFNANGSEFMNYNAQDESTGGNDWDGNSWSDFATNPNYPASYLVPGSAGAVDNAPDGDCPDLVASHFAVGAGPCDVVLVDLDGDGARDVATADGDADSVTVLANDGDGGFGGGPTTVALTAGDAPSSLGAGDLVSGDGTDLAVAAKDADAIRIVSNAPEGTFGVSSSISVAAVGAAPISVAVGDLNGAGTDDVAVALEGEIITGGGGVAVILDGGAPALLTAPVGGFLSPQHVEVCDLDGDGDLDVAATMSGTTGSSATDNVLLYENDGTGAFAAPVTLSVAENPGGLCCGDLDGDGDDDLAVTAELPFPFVVPGAVHVFLNDGLTAGAWSSGDFSLAGSYEGGTLPVDLACGDLSDDSIPGFFSRRDVFAANFGSSNVTRFNGFVPGTNSFGATQSCSSELNPAAVSIAHLNGDATADVVVANKDSDSVTVFLAVPRALAQKFGAGCPGTGGLVPDISAVGLPTLGNPAFGVKVSDARPLAPALLAISTTQLTTPLGGGCDLFLAPPLVLVQNFTDGAGMATSFLSIPAAGTHDGLNLYMQWAVFDPFGPYLGQFAFSDALRVKLGF